MVVLVRNCKGPYSLDKSDHVISPRFGFGRFIGVAQSDTVEKVVALRECHAVKERLGRRRVRYPSCGTAQAAGTYSPGPCSQDDIFAQQSAIYLCHIIRSDVSIAKNYLKENELQALGRLVNAYLDIAKDMAERHIPMTMEDWAKRIDKFLDATDREILQDAGHVTAEYAKEYAESEFEKYRVIQDRLFRSDFDKLTGENPSLPLDTEQE